jgi:hypothetical protein
MKIAKKNEQAFIQHLLINNEYGVNCNKLTLWEYFLLIEKITNEKK